MNHLKIASLENRIARLEKKLMKKSFFNTMLSRELQRFTDDFMDAANYSGGDSTMKIINHPNQEDSDLVFEYVLQPEGHNPLPFYIKVDTQEVEKGLYEITVSRSPYFNKMPFTILLPLNVQKLYTKVIMNLENWFRLRKI
jgi:hypothetical protein